MLSYNYSIIIPHKNIPDLLQRCLDSIPQRDDVQIIIVDDNSNSKIVNFAHFPGKERKNAEVYFDKTGLGAGHARNVGLEHAKGKWLVFADSDDLFSEHCSKLMDLYKDADEDIIYFDFEAVLSTDLSAPSNRSSYARIINFLSDSQNAMIRYTHVIPWGKFIKKELVANNNIRFQEITWGNDVFFSTCTGVMAHKIKLVSDILYVVTEREGSLASVKDKSLKEIITRVKSGIESYSIARNNGFPDALWITAGWIHLLFDRGEYILFSRAVGMLDCSARSKICANFKRDNKFWKRRLLDLINYSLRIFPIPSL